MKNTLVLFGVGHMGSAIARGVLGSGEFDLRIIDPRPDALRRFEELGVRADPACAELRRDEAVILAVPPQDFGGLCAATPCLQGHRGLVLSVMAGVRIASLRGTLGAPNVVRSIPNTPSEVFEGVTVYCKASSAADGLAREARKVLELLGRAVEVDDEALIDPATALCGGGPAFVAYFADALRRFGVEAGIPDEAALTITTQLLRGTSALLAATGKPAMQLCREVMTPGGTTERGIRHFDDEGLSGVVLDALRASTVRSRELGDAIAESLSRPGRTR